DDILSQAIGEFLDRITPGIAALPEARGVGVDALRRQLIVEARQLTASFMVADERLGDRELLAFRRSFGAFEPEVLSGPIKDLRVSDVLTRDHDFTHQPSQVFLRLIENDNVEHTAHAWSYYEAALGIGHAVVALTDLPQRDELVALDAFRTLMLE